MIKEPVKIVKEGIKDMRHDPGEPNYQLPRRGQRPPDRLEDR